MRFPNFTGLVVLVFFGCSDAPPTIDGYTYKTVKIGEQEWFAENLKTTAYRNGDIIPAVLRKADWKFKKSGAMAYLILDEPVSGGYYNWYAVEDSRGLCPSGWHVPTDEEWTVMIDYLGGAEVAGGKMKTTYDWSYGGNGTNSSGFSGLPDGMNAGSGAGHSGYWWSSSRDGSTASAYHLKSGYSTEGRKVGNFPGLLDFGFSVRCVRDAE